MEFPTRYGHASPSKKAMASFHMTPDAYSSPKRVQRTPSQALSDMGVNDTSGSMRTSVFGSCVQVLATVITALFHHVNNNHYYAETTADNNTTRKAKLLYVGLLEKVQKERGEWQGFCGEKQPKNNGGKSCDSAMDILTASLNDFGKEDCIGVLNELLDVSFKNLRGALVLPELYAKHRKKFEAISMETPPSLNALLLIRGLLTDMEREEKLCLFRLLSLWYLLPVVNETLDLRKLIEDKHTLVFSESSEMEFMVRQSMSVSWWMIRVGCRTQHRLTGLLGLMLQTGRKSNRHDHVAMDMLLILVQHREVLFSDLEVRVLTRKRDNWFCVFEMWIDMTMCSYGMISFC
ncbi:TPA: hypothetical protein N0F65_008181 [Lagenidium giganteum]|uniref:Uncharacterized protein n=1 Tax=Lagenidium giganteum TaxID=4803 RepID=A0AAV2YK57_9STRA|nr:TPA: hypothetical protein N0F65_008181 [Lagenidium giganteum]